MPGSGLPIQARDNKPALNQLLDQPLGVMAPGNFRFEGGRRDEVFPRPRQFLLAAEPGPVDCLGLVGPVTPCLESAGPVGLEERPDLGKPVPDLGRARTAAQSKPIPKASPRRPGRLAFRPREGPVGRAALATSGNQGKTGADPPDLTVSIGRTVLDREGFNEGRDNAEGFIIIGGQHLEEGT